jgi:hypothetical protein
MPEQETTGGKSVETTRKNRRRDDAPLGFDGVVAATQDEDGPNGRSKTILVRRDDDSTLPAVLVGKTLTAFETDGFSVGSAIRVYGPMRGRRTLDTIEFGRLDVLAMAAIWIGKPRGEDGNVRKRTARPAPNVHRKIDDDEADDDVAF